VRGAEVVDVTVIVVLADVWDVVRVLTLVLTVVVL